MSELRETRNLKALLLGKVAVLEGSLYFFDMKTVQGFAYISIYIICRANEHPGVLSPLKFGNWFFKKQFSAALVSKYLISEVLLQGYLVIPSRAGP